MVVTIYLDEEARGIKADHLKALEAGRYGPILPSVSNSVGNATSGISTPSSNLIANNPVMGTPGMNPPQYTMSNVGPSSRLSFASYNRQAASYPGPAAPNRVYNLMNPEDADEDMDEEADEPEEGDY